MNKKFQDNSQMILNLIIIMKNHQLKIIIIIL